MGVLISGGEVHTVDAEGTVFPGGWVLVEDSQIAAVGPAGSEPAEADERIDASGCVVVPVLVDTHQDLWYCLLKRDLEAGTRLACLEWSCRGPPRAYLTRSRPWTRRGSRRRYRRTRSLACPGVTSARDPNP
jgi:cytosine/adenosine deaminase-related metal-dependent hydrolase